MPIQHLKRYFGYTFWVGLEMVVFSGLPHLVIFPVAAYLLGKEEFGLFIFSLGMVMIIGLAPGGGLAMGVVRELTKLDKQAKDLLISSSLKLCKIAMLLILLLGFALLALLKISGYVNSKTVLIYVSLLIFLYSWNLLELQMVRYRVERRFALRMAWRGLWSLFLLISIPAAAIGGVIGLACAYTASFVLTHILLSWKQRILFKKSEYDAGLAGELKKVWLHMSLASVLGLSCRYIYRIIVGIFYSYSDVTVFFGATNLIDLTTAPMDMLSQLLLSMLSSYSSLRDVGKRQKYMVLAAAISIASVATGLILFGGRFILSVMFPKFADESTEILWLIIVTIPFSAAIFFCRPFIVKFGPIKFTPILNGITFVAHIVPALLLISQFGLKGAAISYDIGYGISAISYVVALVWTFKLRASDKT